MKNPRAGSDIARSQLSIRLDAKKLAILRVGSLLEKSISDIRDVCRKSRGHPSPGTTHATPRIATDR